MTRDHEKRRAAYREAWLRLHGERTEREQSTVAPQTDDEDWPFLTALLGGVTVALIVNTFIGVMPV